MQCKKGMIGIAEQILARAQAAGVVREDVGPEDIGFLISAAASREGNHARYLRILLDGLRPVGASALPA